MPTFQPYQPKVVQPQYKGIRPLRIIIEEKKSKGIYLRKLSEDFFSCTCYHADTGHFLLEGKCDYPYCDCLQFSPLEIELKIGISLADIFKFENKECGLDIYPEFWIKFKDWLKENKNDTSKSL